MHITMPTTFAERQNTNLMVIHLCRRIRGLPEGDRTVVLVVTGQAEPTTLEEVLDAGADDYVEKPVDVALLSIRLAVAERSVGRQEERARARAVW